MLQTNSASGTTRQLRASPVGPDGKPHFEVLEAEVDWRPGLSNWSPVSEEAARMLHACAAGRGDCHYRVGESICSATLGADGFVDQTDLSTGARRPLRPAPWLGHGSSRVVDPTDGWVPMAEPLQMAEPLAAPPPFLGMMGGGGGGGGWGGGGSSSMATVVTTTTTTTVYAPAATFYQPEACPMGTVVDPISLAPTQTVGPAHPVGPAYFYRPQNDAAVPMAWPVG